MAPFVAFVSRAEQDAYCENAGDSHDGDIYDHFPNVVGENKILVKDLVAFWRERGGGGESLTGKKAKRVRRV